MTLTDLRSTGLVFCRLSLNWGLSDVFLMRLGGGRGLLGRSPQKGSAFLGTCHLPSQVVVTLITWSRCCLPGFFTLKLPFSSFHTLICRCLSPLLVGDVSTYIVGVSSVMEACPLSLTN